MTPLKKFKKNGPRTKETQELWDVGAARLGIDIQRLQDITRAFESEKLRAAEAAKSYYVGGLRIVIAGIPCRVAPFVKGLRNRKYIGIGT